MPTSYTSILKLALPATNELSGTWGTVVNQNITAMIEEAIAGMASVSTWTAASHTLTTANGTTSESRCAILACSGAPGAAATVICPAVTKLYVVQNGVSGGYAVTLKTSGGTGISVPNGRAMYLYCDGTNVVEAASYVAQAGTATTATSATTITGLTASVTELNYSTGVTSSIQTQLNSKGAGTVTSASVVSANGFGGSVATATSTPAITLTTSVSGLMKGNGTAASAAVAGTDYVAPGATTTSGLTMATARVLGRTTASTGAIEEISIGSGLTLSGGVLSATGGGGGSGTVTSVSVVSANGFSGSVATATTTPAITITTTINGLLKGNGTAISAAVAATDYAAAGSVSSAGLTMATNKLLGRSTSGTGAIEELTIGSGLSLSAGTLTASGATTLNAITAATGSAVIMNGNNAIDWRWSLTSVSNVGFWIRESAASTAGGSPILMQVSTVAGSTAAPLWVAVGSSTRILADNSGVTLSDGASTTVTVTSAGLTLNSTTWLTFGAGTQLSSGTSAANGAVATTLGSVGPTGASTTVQGWFKIKDSGGTVRYIPYW